MKNWLKASATFIVIMSIAYVVRYFALIYPEFNNLFFGAIIGGVCGAVLTMIKLWFDTQDDIK